MAYIPYDAEWYLADIVQRFRVQGDPRIVIHINTVLIQASRPDDAYAKAMALGEEGNMSYLNPAGRKVTSKFVGLGNLNVWSGGAHGRGSPRALDRDARETQAHARKEIRGDSLRNRRAERLTLSACSV